MRSTLQILFIFAISLAAMNTFAAPYYSLESNQVVKEGDPMAKVQAACGTPAQVSIRDEVISTPTEITEWVYMTGKPLVEDPTRPLDYLPYLTVVFSTRPDSNGSTVSKVIELKQNPSSSDVRQFNKSERLEPNEQAHAPCRQGSIKIGDEMPAVQAACGPPTLINNLQSSVDVTKKVVEWNYEKNSPPIPLKFEFENGILKQIKNGP